METSIEKDIKTVEEIAELLKVKPSFRLCAKSQPLSPGPQGCCRARLSLLQEDVLHNGAVTSPLRRGRRRGPSAIR